MLPLKGVQQLHSVQWQHHTLDVLSKPKESSTHEKIIVTSKSPVGDISVVTLIRTDTTLDHSQKAKKVCCKHSEVHNTNNKRFNTCQLIPRSSLICWLRLLLLLFLMLMNLLQVEEKQLILLTSLQANKKLYVPTDYTSALQALVQTMLAE